MDDSIYWDLYRSGFAALREARLAASDTLLTQALAEARRLADGMLVDRARCNLAAVKIMQGTTAGVEADLTRVLGTSRDAKARQLAAYNLANLHDSARISRFYAEMSLDLAHRLGDRFSQGASAYLLGIIELEEGHPHHSLNRLREALDTEFGENAPSEQMLALSLLGYVLMMTGNRPGAMEALEASEKPGLAMYEPTVQLNLGFSYLEIGEPERALEHGRRALGSLDERPMVDLQHHKHALYLLGESHALRGEVRKARDYFWELQRKYYPQFPDLTELLLAVRTHGFLSWMRA